MNWPIVFGGVIFLNQILFIYLLHSLSRVFSRLSPTIRGVLVAAMSVAVGAFGCYNCWAWFGVNLYGVQFLLISVGVTLVLLLLQRLLRKWKASQEKC